MSKHDPRVTLAQIAGFIAEAREYARDQTLATLLADQLRLRAFERVLECMGEAVKRLPQELRARYPQVPWAKVAGMRDHLSHAYDDIEHVTLWDALHLHVPILEATILQMLTDLGGEPMAGEEETPPA